MRERFIRDLNDSFAAAPLPPPIKGPMKHVSCWLLLLLWAMPAMAMPAQVIRVVDGDSIEIQAEMWVMVGSTAQLMRSPVSVRVVGVDTPEIRSSQLCERELAIKARGFVQAWVGSGAIDITIVGLDKYSGRIDAHVLRADQNDLAAALIAAKVGRAYDGGKRLPWC